MNASQVRLDQIAEDIARAGTVEDVVAAVMDECDVSAAEAHRLVGVQADRLSTEIFSVGVLPTDEVYDPKRYEEWLTRELRTTFAAALEKVEEDVAGFLKVVFCNGDEPSAEFNAAIYLGSKKRVAQAISSVPVGYFCRDGLAHLREHGADWARHPYTSPGWSRVGTYVVNRDDEGL